MNLEGHIEVTELDERALIRAAYAASIPKGLGFLHARDGGLDDATVDEIIEDARKYQRGEVDMDYVHGRAVKLSICHDDGKRYVKLDWYDHGREAMKRMLRELALPDVEARISKAQAEDEEAERRYAARQARAATALLNSIHSHGGTISKDEEPWKNYYMLPEGDSLSEGLSYGLSVAEQNGWIEWSTDYRKLSLTESGRAAMGNAQSEPAGTP